MSHRLEVAGKTREREPSGVVASGGPARYRSARIKPSENAPIASLITRLVAASCRRPWIVAALALVLTGVAALYATRTSR